MKEWAKMLDAFDAHQRAQARAPRTMQNRRALLMYLAKTTGKRPNEITRLDLEAHLGRGVAPASMQRERSDMQRFFAWAKREGHIKKDPSAKLEPVRVPRGRPRPLTLEQVELLLTSGAYRKTRTMILLAVYQGLRAHEIAKFHGSHLDHTLGVLRVLGKGGKERVLPLHPIIRDQAADYPRDGYWFPSQKGHVTMKSVSTVMSAAIERAGITDPKITGHSLRHTYGTELVQAGVDIRIVQELMRHESLNSTQIYTLVSEKQQREALLRLPMLTVPAHSGRLTA